MMKPARLMVGTAVFCLLLSGAAGLVYEVVWMRYLALFLGHTAYGVIAALVAFMGGLAMGNAWLGKWADKVRRPLALYAWLEIGIGIYAIFFPAYYEFCHRVFVAMAHGWAPGSRSLLALKFAFSLFTIFIPTVLMGGTLPVLVKLVTRSLGELRERVSTLYFINSAGAVAGCFLADFCWIPSWGLPATVWAGAVMNLLVGVVALVVNGWLRENRLSISPSIPADSSAEAETEEFTQAELRLAILGIGLSGFVAMLYEIVWTRLLALSLGSSTHAFSIMLITFISGITIGAGVVGRWRKLRRTLDAFAWTELALAGTLLFSMWFYDLLPFWFMQIAGMLVRRPAVFPIYGLAQALICFGVMFVPTVLLGMTLPLVSRVATAEVARTGRSVGAVFAVNTLGTVLGAALTGLWLLPWLGLAGALALGAALNAAIGLTVLGRHRPQYRTALLVGVPLSIIILVVLAQSIFADRWQRAFTRALWREVTPLSLKAFRSVVDQTKLSYYRDGAGATVSVTEDEINNVRHLALAVNGKTDASTGIDVSTQVLLGHVPMLLRPSSQRVLVVGLGSGMTCGAVLRHPSVTQLDVVEISPEVAQAARQFAVHNDKVLDNPKLHLVTEDAKTFLQLADHKYDVIISEPSNPWMAGVAGVFSREYYQNCRDRLQPDGFMAQWVQVYETDNEAFLVVLRTFRSVFPYLSVWMTAPGDLLLLGMSQLPRVDLQAIQDRFAVPSVKSDLERIDIFRLPVFLAREMISPDIAPYIAPDATRIHSDYYPVLEYMAQRAFFARSETTLPLVYDENQSVRPSTILAHYLRSHKLTEDDFNALSLFKLARLMPLDRQYRSILQRWSQDFPQSTNLVELSAKANDHGVPEELEVQQLRTRRDFLMEQAPKNPQLLRYYAHFMLRAYTLSRSVFYLPPSDELETVLRRLIQVDPSNQRIYRLNLAELAWDRQDDNRCYQLTQEALNQDTNTFGPPKFDLDHSASKRVLARMISSCWRAGQPALAWQLCQQAKEQGYLDPTSESRDLMLELVYRKIEEFVLQSQLAPAN
jgi:spermidine synthase